MITNEVFFLDCPLLNDLKSRSIWRNKKMPVVDAFVVHLDVPSVDFGCDSLVPGASYYHAPRATVDHEGRYECDISQLTFVGAFLGYEKCDEVKRSTKTKKALYLHAALFQKQNEQMRINGKSFFVNEADVGRERQTVAEKLVKFRHIFSEKMRSAAA